jgi:membrane-associated protein
VLGLLDVWLHDHLWAVVFLGALVDAVGIPFPGRIMLITIGSLSSPALDGAGALLVVALAVAGTVAGDHVWYLLGRVRGRRLFEAYCRVMRLSRARRVTADRLIRRYGALALVAARIAATLRVVVIPLAVSRGMSYGRFLTFDTVGAAVWAVGLVALGRTAAALGAEGGLVGTLAIVGALAGASVAMSLLAHRWLSGRARASRA